MNEAEAAQRLGIDQADIDEVRDHDDGHLVVLADRAMVITHAGLQYPYRPELGDFLVGEHGPELVYPAEPATGVEEDATQPVDPAGPTEPVDGQSEPTDDPAEPDDAAEPTEEPQPADEPTVDPAVVGDESPATGEPAEGQDAEAPRPKRRRGRS